MDLDKKIKELEQKVSAAVLAFTQELAGVRTNRPSPSLVEDLKIEYFGQEVPIKQLGSITVAPPRDLVVNLWDPSSIQQVAKAIEDSKRGFNPQIRGSAIYITMPPLSEERRGEMMKIVKSQSEEHRIRLRSLRDETNKAIERAASDKQITEDQKFKAKERVQKAIDKGNAEIETASGKKMKELQE